MAMHGTGVRGEAQQKQYACVTSPVYFMNTTKIDKRIIILFKVLVLRFITDYNC